MKHITEERCFEDPLISNCMDNYPVNIKALMQREDMKYGFQEEIRPA
jgi:hypothetical protein